MSGSLRVKVDERLDIARFVEQHKTVLFNTELSEEQKTEAWSRILAECAARGHHWVKGKDVTYLKKSKWPGIKRDAIEHYQADMKSDVTHRKKLTEADVIVLKAISFDTENLGSFSENDATTRAPAVSEQRESDVTQQVTVEVKTGRPLDFLACGMPLTDEVDKFDNGLFINLFGKNQQEARKTTIYSADQEQRYSKRQRIDDDGPIDHDLMAALGFGKNRQRDVNDSSEQVIGQPTESDNGDCHRVTTIGDYLRSMTGLSAAVKSGNTLTTGNTVTMHSPNVIERGSSIESQKCTMSPPKVTALNSTSTIASSKEICRDLKSLQKKAIEAQITRDEAMTKYYQLKLKKLELEIAHLQRDKNENEDFHRK